MFVEYNGLILLSAPLNAKACSSIEFLVACPQYGAKRNFGRCHRAFTLIELLVVIAIIAILAAICVISSTCTNQHLSSSQMLK
jgi:prepilin-type N-terminal cleavage/methylation domain-containing protein